MKKLGLRNVKWLAQHSTWWPARLLVWHRLHSTLSGQGRVLLALEDSHADRFPEDLGSEGLFPSRSGIMTEKVVEELSQNPFYYLLSTRIEAATSRGSDKSCATI